MIFTTKSGKIGQEIMNMREDDIKEIKDIEDAEKDLDKLDEILNDVDKFRLQSNRVYYKITRNTKYTNYIAEAGVLYKLPVGNMRFEDITHYLTRRKAIKMLRHAVNEYLIFEAKKATEDKK